MLQRFGWTAYILAMLSLRPHAFFTRLAQLPWYGNMLRTWADGLNVGPFGKVLEVGCSAGALSHQLAERGRRVVGIDRSARAIRSARLGPPSGTTAAVFLLGNALALPFANAHFDATLAASVLNIVPERNRLVAEMARVTVPGGRVSCLFPTPQMNAATARGFAERYGLTGFAAQALSMWVALPSKLEPGSVVRLFDAERLANPAVTPLLDGMVCAVTGTKMID